MTCNVDPEHLAGSGITPVLIIVAVLLCSPCCHGESTWFKHVSMLTACFSKCEGKRNLRV